MPGLKKSELPNEKELLLRLSADDETVITLIYKQYWEELFLSAYRLLKNKEACEDMLQDIFLGLWLKRKNLHITTSLEGYLFTAIRYRVFTAIERGRVHLDIFEDLEQRLWSDTDADTRLYQKELQHKVNAIVAGLPSKCREIYRLSREEQLSHKEIAEKLSVSVKTVENQLTIALRRIRKGISDLLPLVALFLGK